MREGENGGISLSKLSGLFKRKAFRFHLDGPFLIGSGVVRVVAKKASIPTTMVAGISHSSIIGCA